MTCVECRERGPYCGLCRCMYSCSCKDDEGRQNICKHVHAVVTFQKEKIPPKPKDVNEDIQMLQEIVYNDTFETEAFVKEKLLSIYLTKFILL